MTDDPTLTAADLLNGWEDTDDAAGLGTAASLSVDALSALTVGILDDQGDEWDLPTRLYGISSSRDAMTATGGLVAEALTADLDADAQQQAWEALRTGRFETAGASGLVTVVRLIGEGPHHPYSVVVGQHADLRDGVICAVFETWLTVDGDDADIPLLADAVRAPDGRYEVRICQSVDRLGRAVIAAKVRGGGTLVETIPDDLVGFTPDHALTLAMGGRINDAFRAYLGLPGQRRTETPWLQLAGRWASICVHSLDNLLAQTNDVDAACRQLADMRPDTLASMVWEFADRETAIRTAAGLTPDGPLPADLKKQIVAQPPFLAVLPPEGPARINALEAKVAEIDPFSRGWSSLGKAARLMNSMFGMDIDEPDWWSDTAITNLVGVDPSEAATPIGDLLADSRFPDWFRTSASSFFDRCAATTVDAPSVLDPD